MRVQDNIGQQQITALYTKVTQFQMQQKILGISHIFKREINDDTEAEFSFHEEIIQNS